MFGIGGFEILIILLVAVLVVGPEKLPKIARSFGQFTAGMRKLSTEFQRTLNLEAEIEQQKLQNEIIKEKPDKTIGTETLTTIEAENRAEIK